MKNLLVIAILTTLGSSAFALQGDNVDYSCIGKSLSLKIVTNYKSDGGLATKHMIIDQKVGKGSAKKTISVRLELQFETSLDPSYTTTPFAIQPGAVEEKATLFAVKGGTFLRLLGTPVKNDDGTEGHAGELNTPHIGNGVRIKLSCKQETFG